MGLGWPSRHDREIGRQSWEEILGRRWWSSDVWRLWAYTTWLSLVHKYSHKTQGTWTSLEARRLRNRHTTRDELEHGNWGRPRYRTSWSWTSLYTYNEVALKLLSNLQNPTTSPSYTNTSSSSPRMESLLYMSPDTMWYYPCDKLTEGRVNTNRKPNTHKQVET